MQSSINPLIPQKRKQINFPRLQVYGIKSGSKVDILLQKLSAHKLTRTGYQNLKQLGFKTPSISQHYQESILLREKNVDWLLTENHNMLSDHILDLHDFCLHDQVLKHIDTFKLYRFVKDKQQRSKLLVTSGLIRRDSCRLKEALNFGKKAYELDNNNMQAAILIASIYAIDRNAYASELWLKRAFSLGTNKRKFSNELAYIYDRSARNIKRMIRKFANNHKITIHHSRKTGI